jgi:hypothetical protein
LLLVLIFWAIGVAVERSLFYRRVDVNQFPTLDLCEFMLTSRRRVSELLAQYKAQHEL